MIGIGGCGMSGLARLLAARGARTLGSESVRSEASDALECEGVRVSFEQDAGCLPDSCDLVVASAAIKPDHPEMLAADARGIPTMTYAEALGVLMRDHTGVSIAGTHGKSTTTAMLGCLLVDCGLDPSVIVGATCAQLGTGACAEQPGAPVGHRVGAFKVPFGPLKGLPGLLIAEACEFNRSFHNQRPRYGYISNVEADHLDVYNSLDGVVEAFAEFARGIAPSREGGVLLIGHEGAHRGAVAAGLDCEVQTIGWSPEADWCVRFDPASRGVTLLRGSKVIANWTMLIPGAHNAMNSAAACALAVLLGADPKACSASLSRFRGVDRRSQFLGERRLADGTGSVRVWDDYGHHPTEIDATLRALRDFERIDEQGGRLICVFQPHQHSRTRFLLNEFATAFGCADVVIVPQIYFVRDSIIEKQKVSSSDLVDRLRTLGVRAMHLHPFEAIVEQLESLCRPRDVLVVMGAGPVWKVAHGYMRSSAGSAVGGLHAGSAH